MKKIVSLLIVLAAALSASAMSLEQARERALFLTDKMAYELNLTDDQYEACYEINLDYFLEIASRDDVESVHWTNRNVNLNFVLVDWQYRAYCCADYFYRPIYWAADVWHFPIYARYPCRTFFYFDRPVCYVSYVGCHSWRACGRSWYDGRVYGSAWRRGGVNRGMRDSYTGTNNHGGFSRESVARSNGGSWRGSGSGTSNHGYNDRSSAGRTYNNDGYRSTRESGADRTMNNSGVRGRYQERGSSTRQTGGYSGSVTRESAGSGSGSWRSGSSSGSSSGGSYRSTTPRATNNYSSSSSAMRSAASSGGSWRSGSSMSGMSSGSSPVRGSMSSGSMGGGSHGGPMGGGSMGGGSHGGSGGFHGGGRR